MIEEELLQEQLDKLDTLSPQDLSSWRMETLPIIAELFGDKSSRYKQFLHIGYMEPEYTDSHIEKFKNCISGFIKCVSIRKTSGNTNQDSTNSHVAIYNNPQFTQSQTQTQTQTMDIKDIIKDELPPAKMREIEEILQTEEPEKTKLEKVGEVLQKVGIGVTSSVLARIITNSIGIF